MAYSSYHSYSDVAVAHQIVCTETEFVEWVDVPVSDYLRSEIAFVIREVSLENAEFTACETLIYPLLKEVWKPFVGTLMLWGHEPLNYDADLCGTPDYYVAKVSPLGKKVRNPAAVLVVVEAKRDDFEQGWGQCLAAMLAAHKLQKDKELTIYGVVSNGRSWQFGRLQALHFTLDSRLFYLEDLEKLYGILHAIFTQCKEQVLRQPVLM